MLGPGAFIDLAEETGAVVPLGTWVLRAACREAAGWRAGIPGADELRLSVNLSPKQVAQADLVRTVESILVETGYPPDRLTLEITESVILRPDTLTVGRLQALRDLGIELAVDDFGTAAAGVRDRGPGSPPVRGGGSVTPHVGRAPTRPAPSDADGTEAV
ncbi:EAL domain-containing protein [Cryptosporangium phraense]|uniref:EAL domain-containing protein n=1 Tax=Cryptosporangium phraense TaxID=2593070 RepID=UPI003B84621F